MNSSKGSPYNMTLGVRIFFGQSSGIRVANEEILGGEEVKAIVHLTRQGKIAFHFLKCSLPKHFSLQYFPKGKFKLASTWPLPEKIVQGLGLTNHSYQLTAGRYHAVDLGNHITVVIPINPQPITTSIIGIF